MMLLCYVIVLCCCAMKTLFKLFISAVLETEEKFGNTEGSLSMKFLPQK